MPITRSDFENLCDADLQVLLENETPEGIIIEYKRKLYGSTDSEKKEFLKDVSSFANTAGGHLFLGIAATDGVPTEIIGLAVDNLDSEQQRFESLLRDRMEPRIVGIRMQPVALANGRHVLAIRIPKSWSPPHAVLHNKSRLIFARNSAGAHEASVDEMRAMFTTGMTLREQARGFQRQRLTEIHSGEAPFALAGDQGRIVLHIMPFSAFSSDLQLDPRRMHGQDLPPMWGLGYNQGYNADGYWTSRAGGERSGYVQVFRNGIIESAAGDVRVPTAKPPPNLYAEDVENEVLAALERYLPALARAEVPPPLFIVLAGVRMQGTRIIGRPLATMEASPLRKSDWILPTVVVEDYTGGHDYRRAVKPIFDAIWNAAGYEGSRSYDHDGNWARSN
jgi:Putative DNA-binding domain